MEKFSSIARLIRIASCVVAVGVLCCPASFAKEIRYIYLHNNGVSPADIWVNQDYQGWVPAGETVYVDKLGFVTADSDRLQADGTRSPRRESHGGWSGYGDTVVTICQVKKGTAYQMDIKLPKEWGTDLGAKANEEPKVWFGEDSSGSTFEVGDEVKPIYKGVEGNDCGTKVSQGQIKTNVVSDESGEWMIQYSFFGGGGGTEYWTMGKDGSLTVRNGRSLWTGRWSRNGESFECFYGTGGYPEFREWWKTRDGVARGTGIVSSSRAGFQIIGNRVKNN